MQIATFQSILVHSNITKNFDQVTASMSHSPRFWASAHDRVSGQNFQHFTQDVGAPTWSTSRCSTEMRSVPRCWWVCRLWGGLGSFLTHGGGSGPNFCMDFPVIYKMNPWKSWRFNSISPFFNCQSPFSKHQSWHQDLPWRWGLSAKRKVNYKWGLAYTLSSTILKGHPNVEFHGIAEKHQLSPSNDRKSKDFHWNMEGDCHSMIPYTSQLTSWWPQVSCHASKSHFASRQPGFKQKCFK